MTKQTRTTAAQLAALNAADAQAKDEIAAAAATANAMAAEAAGVAPAAVVDTLSKAQADRLTVVNACFNVEASAAQDVLKASDDTRLALLALAESKPTFDLVWADLSQHSYFAARTVAGGGSKAGESVLKSTLRRYFKLAALDLVAPAVEGLKGWDRYSRDDLQPAIKAAEGASASKAGAPRGARAGGVTGTSAGQKTDTSNGPTLVGKEITVDTFLNAKGGASVADVVALVNNIKANVDKKAALILLAEIEDMLSDLQAMGLK